MSNSLPMERETSWHAVQTKPHQETLAAASVEQAALEVYLPRIKTAQYVAGISREVIKALFPGYFFVRFAAWASLESVRFARGVARVVSTGAGPAVLADEVIQEIRSRERSDGFVHLRPAALHPGDQVVIRSGPFEGWMGRVEQERDDGRRVAILLEAIGCARVVVETRWVAGV